MSSGDKLRGGGVRAVDAALDILEYIGFAQEEVGISQISDRLGLAKGAVFRHLRTLTSRGYLVQNSGTLRYELGSRLGLLGRLAPTRPDLLGASEAPLAELRDRVGETVVLSMAGERGARVVSRLQAKTTVQIGVQPGGELPYHCSAQGKVLLAFGPRSLLDGVSRHSLPASAPNTITRMRELQRELARIRKLGWAQAAGEMLVGINAIAAPVFSDAGECVASVAVVGSVQFVPRFRNERIVLAVRRAADRVSANLGYRRAAR